jgi:hypothetical protein
METVEKMARQWTKGAINYEERKGYTLYFSAEIEKLHNKFQLQAWPWDGRKLPTDQLSFKTPH